MKKVICILAVLAMALGLMACGSSSGGNNKDSGEAQKEAFDFEAAVSALKSSDSFKDAKEQLAEDIEVEYDVTLEDAEGFAMYKDANSFNMFIVAKAKDGNEKLMFEELQNVVDAYSDNITNSTYPEVQKYSAKVDAKVVRKDGNVYVCIIAEDADDLASQIES